MKPTSSKGKSPWKAKNVTGGSRAGGDILVNQALGKVKLEEDFVEMKPRLPVSSGIENDVTSTATTTDAFSGWETITEEFVVTKVEVDNPMSPEESPPSQDSGDSCSCGNEIDSLKSAMEELRLKVDKQNEVICEIKSSLRNAVMSLMNCCKDEEEDEGHRQGSSNSQGTSGSTAEDSVLSERSFVTHCAQNGVTRTLTRDNPGKEDQLSSVGTVECTDAARKGSQVPDIAPSRPCVSSSIVDHEQSTVNAAKNVDEKDNQTSSNVADNDKAGQGEDEADQKKGVNDNQEGYHHVDKLDQNLPSKKTARREGRQDNLEEEGRSPSMAIVELADDDPVTDESSNESSVSKETCSTVLPKQGDENNSMMDLVDFDDNGDSSIILPDKKVRKSNSKGIFRCSKCGKSFTSDLDLRRHRCINSKRRTASEKCHLCPKVFNKGGNLKRHVQSEHEGVRYQCDFCPAKFTKKEKVLRHEMTVHGEQCPPTQQCEICGAHLLNTKTSLRSHINNNHKKSGSSE